MADQNFMDLASKTASGIAGTDYMMLVNNSEAYKALVNDVAEAILGKLTSKSFSGLETTAKNVIGALNELNSKIPLRVNLNASSIQNFTMQGTTSVVFANREDYHAVFVVQYWYSAYKTIIGSENENIIITKNENSYSFTIQNNAARALSIIVL